MSVVVRVIKIFGTKDNRSVTHTVNRVLVKMNVFFHLKVDCSEILCRVFKPKEFDFAATFLIYSLDQKLSSCKHQCCNFVLKLG